MLAQEMAAMLTRRAELMTVKRWTDFIQQLEQKGLYVVIETDTNCRVMSPLGGLMPMPSKTETFSLLTEQELLEKGLTAGHHIILKPNNKMQPAEAHASAEQRM